MHASLFMDSHVDEIPRKGESPASKVGSRMRQMASLFLIADHVICA